MRNICSLSCHKHTRSRNAVMPTGLLEREFVAPRVDFRNLAFDRFHVKLGLDDDLVGVLHKHQCTHRTVNWCTARSNE